MLKTTLKVKDNYVNAYLVPTLPWLIPNNATNVVYHH